jgi:hypothetical protein
VFVALDLLPQRIRAMVEGVDILTGVDPVFAGLHYFTQASYGRAYKDIAHVAYPMHQLHLPKDRRATTLVLPANTAIKVIVHELGHVLDERLNFKHDPTASVTWYAHTNSSEAFAEAFTAWILPHGHGYDKAHDILYKTDRKTIDLFERLADE